MARSHDIEPIHAELERLLQRAPAAAIGAVRRSRQGDGIQLALHQRGGQRGAGSAAGQAGSRPELRLRGTGSFLVAAVGAGVANNAVPLLRAFYHQLKNQPVEFYHRGGFGAEPGPRCCARLITAPLIERIHQKPVSRPRSGSAWSSAARGISAVVWLELFCAGERGSLKKTPRYELLPWWGWPTAGATGLIFRGSSLAGCWKLSMMRAGRAMPRASCSACWGATPMMSWW